METEKLIKLLLSRLAEHKDAYTHDIDAGRIEELCWLIREVIKRSPQRK